MTVDRKNILLWIPHQVGKYSPIFDKKRELYIKDKRTEIAIQFERGTLDLNSVKFDNIVWYIKNEYEEKKLRTYDCFYDGTGMFMHRGFFIHDWLLNCWSDLIDKDIKVIPSTCSTLNGIVREFHLIYIMNKVDGLDKELSVFSDTQMDRFIPKADNLFMENHHIAMEQKRNCYIYITPELKEKTLKAKGKKKLKDVWIMTFKEEWDLLWQKEYGPY